MPHGIPSIPWADTHLFTTLNCMGKWFRRKNKLVPKKKKPNKNNQKETTPWEILQEMSTQIRKTASSKHLSSKPKRPNTKIQSWLPHSNSIMMILQLCELFVISHPIPALLTITYNNRYYIRTPTYTPPVSRQKAAVQVSNPLQQRLRHQ